MTSEIDTPETSAIVPVSPETSAMVDSEMADESDEIRRETKALIEAVKKRAQIEVQTAGDFTRDAYLKAVRQAREAIEENQLIDPERIEKSIELIQKEAEKNWQSVVSEVETLGTRLADAAKAAWNTLMHPESK
ncbi:hypothetical protein H6G89_08735 [Oscillatoria sp. FACHB-1407]|uniref:hypothetical protein n=1 Tax=Oscillatoria sp. FACHB-1407 TaxID=2692847 RepID=UPI0016877ACC|nr:hypothetical protein [Oscillatoria sp. FACHB-1407]MBD2461127.1 hypothetical protein [Oscillatoria sp. FACHB-1407]